jgi:hypothetical protein
LQNNLDGLVNDEGEEEEEKKQHSSGSSRQGSAPTSPLKVQDLLTSD